jgi:uncharacterized protein YndB with AHSA1/START domain
MSVGTDESVLVITRIFDAPPERVFDAWMTHNEWQAWIGPEGTKSDVQMMEPKVGGRYHIRMNLSNGQKMNVVGAYKAIERPKRFVFTWGPKDKPEISSTVTVMLRDVGGKTELTLQHEGLQTVDNRDAHGRGWNSALNKLARYVRGETP